MFGERRTTTTSTIRTMQLFYELKQQFPTVPDHVITSSIANHQQLQQQPSTSSSVSSFQEQMGRSPSTLQQSPTLALDSDTHPSSPTASYNNNAEQSPNPLRAEMDQSVSDVNQNVVKSAVYPKRPNNLNIRPDGWPPNSIQPSVKCRDVHKLLNEDIVSDKPPKSPLNAAKRFPNTKLKKSPKKETISTPTQTTDTLRMSGGGGGGGGVDLSVNVNCSMDWVTTTSPSTSHHKSIAQITPEQPWLHQPTSGRSSNTVNIMMRPPSSEHQPPIDITSQNSSLTYSTSSFDPKKGVQSRLQITVGPGGSSCVTASRGRPRSCFILEEDEREREEIPVRAGSLNDLSSIGRPPAAPVILQQQVRVSKLKIELENEKTRLTAMREEIKKLEDERKVDIVNIELEKQLKREVEHLQYQCSQLATKQNGDFYSSLYTGQREPTARRRMPPRSDSAEGDKWTCHVCTFLNHPDLNHCETCEMPRILHGTNSSSDSLLDRIQRLNSQQSTIRQAINLN